MKPNEIKGCLLKKLKILEAIGSNTAKQQRFVGKGQLRGLNRLLNEREKLLDELVAADNWLSAQTGWEKAGDFRRLIQAMENKRQEILTVSVQALEATKLARDHAADELRNIRAKKALRNRYADGWKTLQVGRRLNQEG